MIMCSVKRDFARLCRPLIPIASDPRQRLSTLKSDILILHSRKQVPLMQPLVLQFFQRRKMLLKCFHQRTIDFSVLAFFVLYFLFFLHPCFLPFLFIQIRQRIDDTHTHTHTFKSKVYTHTRTQEGLQIFCTLFATISLQQVVRSGSLRTVRKMLLFLRVMEGLLQILCVFS